MNDHDLLMEAVLIEARLLVEEAWNQVAVMRGPIVYCLESVDLPEGVRIDQVRVSRGASWKAHHNRGLLGGITILETQGCLVPAGHAGPLYHKAAVGPTRQIPLRLIPYYAWCNRGRSEMMVWIPVY